MTRPLDHIAYLSQEIGARPAGTEEEQQAALYIAEQFRSDARLSAEIEDFTCLTSSNLPKAICCAVSVVLAILSIAVPQMAIPALLGTAIAAALLVMELIGRPVLSRLFMKGVSQNVVAKYEPVYSSEGAGQRRRKIVVVANYDSGKVRRELSHGMAKFYAPLQIASLAGMILLPLVIAVRHFAFASASPEISLTFNIVICILVALVAVQLVFMLMEKLGAYNEAANCNASGVAVMLEVARRIGNGEVGASPISESGCMYGEDAARAAGVVPEGATVSYEGESETAEDGLAAAKAAIAAMTGKPVPGAARSFDIAANLVQVKDMPIAQPTDEDMAKSREEAKAALSSVPADTIADAIESAAEEAAAKTAEAAASVAAAGAAAAGATAAAASVEGAASAAASVPDWYRKATEKAKKKDVGPALAQRSRYADAPTSGGTFAAAAAAAKVAQEHAGPVEPMPSAVSVFGERAAGAPHPAAPEATAPSAPIVAESFATGPMAPVVSEAGTTGPMAPASAVNAQFGGMPNATTAMPALDAGNLDLEALRAVASSMAANPAATGNISPETMPLPVSVEATQALPVEVLQERLSHVKQVSAPIPMNGMPVAPSTNIPHISGIQPAIEIPTVQVGSLSLPALDLPPIETPADPVLAPLSPDDFKQRAPLAFTAEGDEGQESAKGLLAMSLPSIDLESDEDASGESAHSKAPAAVSATSAFAPVASTGAGSAVGSEMLSGIDPDDLYVDDADDSAYATDVTETGAFAGPGYVDVPQSRIGKFFSKFRRKKHDESTAQEWLGVDDDFDARRGGSKRGGWESFRDDSDDWSGGGFSNLRARFSKVDSGHADGDTEQDSGNDAFSEQFESCADAEPVKSYAPEQTDDPMPQIYSFAAGDINTEIWFVALGSELMDNGGIKAFLADHASEMRGAVVINLESLGAGELCSVDKEGLIKTVQASSRMKRYMHRAAQASSVEVGSASISWRDSAASFALKHRLQAVTIAGMDGGKPAFFGEADDVIENVNPDLLEQRADFVVELLKNI